MERNRTARTWAVAAAALVLLNGIAESGDESAFQPGRYVCKRTSQRPTIDGRLDEGTWLAAAATSEFVHIEGRDKPAPRLKTRAWLLWNDEALFIAARLEDPDVRARLTGRDEIVYHDNDFEVFLDPDGDGRNYMEIEINALNAIFDLLLERAYREGGPARHEWDVGGLQSAVFVDGTLNDASDRDRGWTLEMAIPWKALAEHAGVPCPPRPGDRWRVNFSRVQWPDNIQGGADTVGQGIESNWVWSPLGETDMHIPSRWGVVEFSGDIVEARDESSIDRRTPQPQGDRRP